MEKTNQTKKGKELNGDIPLWKIMSFIDKYKNGKEYKEDCKDSGEDNNSEWDRGFDSALDLLKEELKEILERDPYK